MVGRWYFEFGTLPKEEYCLSGKSHSSTQEGV